MGWRVESPAVWGVAASSSDAQHPGMGPLEGRACATGAGECESLPVAPHARRTCMRVPGRALWCRACLWSALRGGIGLSIVVRGGGLVGLGPWAGRCRRRACAGGAEAAVPGTNVKWWPVGSEGPRRCWPCRGMRGAGGGCSPP